MPTPTHAATGRTALALNIAAAILIPLRLTLYYASQSHPSRPMAAVTFPGQSSEDLQTNLAEHDALPSAVVLGRIA